MVDFAQRLKELREKKAAEALAKANQENNNAEVKADEKQTTEVSVPNVSGNQLQNIPTKEEEVHQDVSSHVGNQANVGNGQEKSVATIGTARTSEIDHLAFMSNLQELQEAIHTQHPKMPVLLMMIHKHLRTDPELVTTLSEEEIGVIVNGLKIQTKTELTGTVLKQPKTKKTNLSTDMF